MVVGGAVGDERSVGTRPRKTRRRKRSRRRGKEKEKEREVEKENKKGWMEGRIQEGGKVFEECFREII